MANHNHLSSATCYNVAMHKHDYYNQFFELGQQKINFKFYELSLPDDDPVFTLKNVMEEMDFTALLAQYSGKGKSGFNPIMKYGVLTYANMRGIREIGSIITWQDFLMPLILFITDTTDFSKKTDMMKIQTGECSDVCHRWHG